MMPALRPAMLTSPACGTGVMARDTALKDGYLPLFAGAELVRRSGSLAQFPAESLIGTLPPIIPPSGCSYALGDYLNRGGSEVVGTPNFLMQWRTLPTNYQVQFLEYGPGLFDHPVKTTAADFTPVFYPLQTGGGHPSAALSVFPVPMNPSVEDGQCFGSITETYAVGVCAVTDQALYSSEMLMGDEVAQPLSTSQNAISTTASLNAVQGPGITDLSILFNTTVNVNDAPGEPFSAQFIGPARRVVVSQFSIVKVVYGFGFAVIRDIYVDGVLRFSEAVAGGSPRQTGFGSWTWTGSHTPSFSGGTPFRQGAPEITWGS